MNAQVGTRNTAVLVAFFLLWTQSSCVEVDMRRRVDDRATSKNPHEGPSHEWHCRL